MYTGKQELEERVVVVDLKVVCNVPEKRYTARSSPWCPANTPSSPRFVPKAHSTMQ